MVDDEDEALARLRRASHTGSTDSLNTLVQSTSVALDDGETSLAAETAETAVPSSSATSRPPSPAVETSRPLASQRGPYHHAGASASSNSPTESSSPVRPSRPKRPRLGGPIQATLSAQGEHRFQSVLSSTSCGRLILGMDWSAAPLGDFTAWSPSTRIHVLGTLSDPWPNAILIDDVLLYNDAYAILIGSRHPNIFGKSGAEAVNADLPGAWQASLTLNSLARHRRRLNELPSVGPNRRRQQRISHLRRSVRSADARRDPRGML